jgi:hypothetical protein
MNQSSRNDEEAVVAVTIDEERRDIKRSLGTQFMENQVLQPIATGWFEKQNLEIKR